MEYAIDEKGRFGKTKVVLVIPAYGDQFIKKAERLREAILRRANNYCKVIILKTNDWKGWVHAHNWAIENVGDFDYYGYLCADLYPGRRFLSIAIESLKSSGKQFFCFNDGKWNGSIATSGLISNEYLKTLKEKYVGSFLNPRYKYHYADTELTLCAMNDEVYCYNPDSVLMEVDYEKDFQSVNQTDRELFVLRKARQFDGKIRNDLCERFE